MRETSATWWRSIALAMLVTGCAGGVDLDEVAPVATDTVRTEGNEFLPQVVTVPAGSEVTWSFVDRTAHNVVGEDFGSAVHRDGTFTYTFADPGTFDYECTLHPGMAGRVIVTQ